MMARDPDEWVVGQDVSLVVGVDAIITDTDWQRWEGTVIIGDGGSRVQDEHESL